MYELKKVILKDGTKYIAWVKWKGDKLSIKEWMSDKYEIREVNKDDIKIIRDCNNSKPKKEDK